MYGVEEFFWTAYFCEDAYFRASNPVAEYLQDEVDGPSSGVRMNRFPIWDPRFYFVSVLVIRPSQITMEWKVLLEIISGDLDKYVYTCSPVSFDRLNRYTGRPVSRGGPVPEEDERIHLDPEYATAAP